MKIEKLLVIPQRDNISEYMALSKEYGCGFEYNDFFLPSLLDDEEKLKNLISFYKKSDHIPEFSTVHGAFFDITVFSDDPRIKEVSDFRVRQSLDIAKELGATAVIFHTNYIPSFNLESYRNNWVLRNAAYWSEKLIEYPMLNIYIENMFDMDCALLLRLGEKLKEYPNFGICLDYAHAHVFGDERNIEDWVKRLSPYVKHIHINDNDFASDMHLAVGDGKIDWKQFKKYYKEYLGGVSVLLEVTGIEKAKKSLDFIGRL